MVLETKCARYHKRGRVIASEQFTGANYNAVIDSSSEFALAETLFFITVNGEKHVVNVHGNS